MELYLTRLGNMSYQAAIIICVILLVRQVFFWMKVPKKFSYCLWFIPFFRMICPWTVESVFSLLPIQTVNRMVEQLFGHIRNGSSDIFQQTGSYVRNSGVTVNPSATGDMLPVTVVSDFSEASPVVWSWVTIAGLIWVTGVFVLLLYSVISYWRLKRKLIGSLRRQDNIYLADHIDTPFVLGIWNPRIYLPSGIQVPEFDYVVAHEQTHIRRKDYLMKLIAFFIVSVHWFNPLAWAAFLYMGKDMELSCDEAVLKQLGEECRQAYATALLAFTTGKRRLSGVPLAFGEGSTKGRIRNIMKYKKPFVITIVFATLAVIVLVVGLLTYPKQTLESAGNMAPEANQGEPAQPSDDMSAAPFDEPELQEEEERWSQFQMQLRSDLYAMDFAEGSLTTTGGTIHIYNSSQEEITFGDAYHLSRLEQGDWVDVPYVIENWAFHQPAYPVAGGSMRSMEIDWEWLYGSLPSGTYLLKKEISIPKEEGGYETIELGVHFTL